MSGQFGDFLIGNLAMMFGEIRRQVVVHIVAEEAVSVKRDSTHP